MRRINSIIVIILGILLLTCTVTNAQTLQVALSPDKSKVDRNAIEGMATILFESSVEDLNIVCTEENPDEPIVKVTDNLWYIRINVKKDIDSDGICYRNFLLRSPASAEYYLSTEPISPKQVLYYTISLPNELEPILLEEKSRRLAEKAISIADRDSYLARKIALAALDFCYTIEAEAALREAANYNNAVLYGHTNVVSSVSYSPDGKHIVSASKDKTIRIWDVFSGKELLAITGHTDDVNFATYSPDGNYIASASYDKTIRIWDAKTGNEVNVLKGHTSLVYSVSFSPDGNYIASASYDETIRIWDTKTGKVMQVLVGHTGAVNMAVFSPDGKYIASASDDGTVKIWDVKTGKEIKKLIHPSDVEALSFSHDGRQIVSASFCDSIRIWDIDTENELLVLKPDYNGPIRSIEYSSNDEYVIWSAAYGMITLYDISTESIMGELYERINGQGLLYANISPDEKSIALACGDNTIRIWEIETYETHEYTLDMAEFCINSCKYSPDGKHIATASNDGTVKIWDAETGNEIMALKENTRIARSVSYSADGKFIVSAYSDGEIIMWNSDTGDIINRLKQEEVFTLQSATLDPNSNRIVLSTNVNKIRIWDVITLEELLVFEGAGHVRFAAFSPDGRKIVYSTSDGIVRVFDLETEEETMVLVGHTSSVNSAFYSPDGRKIVSSSDDGTVRVWDTETGKATQVLDEHTSGVNTAIFSPNGKYIASASDDGTVKIWDVESGKKLYTFYAHLSLATDCSFSPNSSHIVSSYFDGEIKIWHIPCLQELIDKTRERFKDNPLTSEERKQYYFE